MIHLLYKRRMMFSLIYGLAMVWFLFLMFPAMPPGFLIFPVIFFSSNFLMAYVLIGHFASTIMSHCVKYDYQKMTLSSFISIKEKNGNKVAKFTLKNNKHTVNFEIESKYGNVGIEYSELNIDNIMIKQNKEYLVEITKEISSINNETCQTLMIPTKIDYFDLEEKFYIYKIM